MTLAISNARIVLADGVVSGGIIIEDGIIKAITSELWPQADECYDAEGRYVSPGFIDLHVHGGGGYDFMDGTARSMLGAAREHMRHGTTLLLPTTVACNDEELERVFSAFREAKVSTEDKPHLYGVHLEGPYLSPLQAGAIDPAYIIEPKAEHVEKVIAMGGEDIKRITFASELPGAMEMCRKLKEMGVVLSLGHTDAEYENIAQAVDAGASLVTHLYSAMSMLRRHNAYRYLGLVESAYLMDELNVEIISDGKHLPPELLRLILKLKDNDKISLITDAVRGAGMPDGSIVRLGSLENGQDAIIRDGVAFVPDGSCFAGSVCTANRCIWTMCNLAGLEVYEAVRMMTYNPAKVLGLENSKGAIHVGYDADLCVFDDDINIKDVFVSGKRMNLEK
ncbi:MAG: N-acetylglucosamine-6-phosphate deacetylase [Oscillospiraceae bacterium]|nr:N-acetylglucosamine-6-phosphate deacetylase [Oscillospiraceae bacterium]